MSTSIKSYPGVLKTTARTQKMLSDTFDILEKGANAFFDIQVALSRSQNNFTTSGNA